MDPAAVPPPLTRRDALRLLTQATALALAALGVGGCGGGEGGGGASGGGDMADEAELRARLDRVRALLGEAEQARTGISDPAASAQVAAQLAIGGALLVLAERLSTLTARVGEVEDRIDDVDDTLGRIRSEIDDVETAVRMA